jgi:type IV secretory pathway VirB10-like protein
LRDHSHIPLEDSDVCAHCGQPLPGRKVVVYGEKGPNRTGIAVTIGLHLLLVAIYLLQPKTEHHAPPKSGAAVVWLPPVKENKPVAKPAEQAPKKTAKEAPPKFTPRQIPMPRLPNTITLPEVKTVEEKPKPQPPKEEAKAPPQEVDMQAYIEAQRKRRGAPAQTDQAEESEAARGTRNALANIAAINGRGGQDPNETGGVFSVTNKTFSTADLKFRGWNPNFKRRWLTAVTVERGSEPDIETAIVKKMIELIRKEKTGDFEWDSHRLNRVVTLSARPQDTQELMNFLYKEMFPEYKPPR